MAEQLTNGEIAQLLERTEALEQFIRNNTERIRNSGINIDWFTGNQTEWQWFTDDLYDAVNGLQSAPKEAGC